MPSRAKLDLLHMPMMAVPIATRVPVITTIHDVIPYVMPEYRSSRAQQINLAVARRMVRRAAAVITPSMHAAGDISRQSSEYPGIASGSRMRPPTSGISHNLIAPSFNRYSIGLASAGHMSSTSAASMSARICRCS